MRLMKRHTTMSHRLMCIPIPPWYSNTCLLVDLTPFRPTAMQTPTTRLRWTKTFMTMQTPTTRLRWTKTLMTSLYRERVLTLKSTRKGRIKFDTTCLYDKSGRFTRSCTIFLYIIRYRLEPMSSHPKNYEGMQFLTIFWFIILYF